MPDREPLRAVTFDLWNTLLYEERGHIRGLRIAAWAGLLEEAGYSVERQALDDVMDSAWQLYVETWTANERFDAALTAERALGTLGLDVPSDLRSELVAAFADAGQRAELRATPGAGECLRSLKDAGLKLGIVCDVGITASPILRAHLHRLGLLGFFDSWAFSDEVGVFKPDPMIFRAALDPLGVQSWQAAHVGDLRRTDIAGAAELGMVTVRYTGVEDDPTQGEPEADFVVASHAEVPVVLGISADAAPSGT